MRFNTENTLALKATHKRWAKEFGQCKIVYLYSMTGFGKTTQAILFAKANYKEWGYFSASEDDFVDRVDDFFVSRNKSRVNTLVILDDLQWVIAPQQRQWLFELLLSQRSQNKNIHFFLLSRAATPEYLSSLRITRQMVVEDNAALKLDYEDIRELMMTYQALAELPPEQKDKISLFCSKNSRGYALGVNAILQRSAEHPNDLKTVIALATRDVENFIDINLFHQWTPMRKEAVIKLSVFPKFTRKMAYQILGEKTDESLKDFVEVGSFLSFKAPDTYIFNDFFWTYLEACLRKCPENVWKPLYEKAGLYYEQERDIEQALRCYRLADKTNKIIELVVYLSENADGCEFARISENYIKDIPTDDLQKNPDLLGAQAMLAAYSMRPNECIAHLHSLKELAEQEKRCRMPGEALTAYVRTVIACPYDTADKLKDNLLLFVDYVRNKGVTIRNIMPTSNAPSLINGGLDLLPWMNNKKILYPIIKSAAEAVMGIEAVGIADASMGEALYEQNKKTNAMVYLTKALSDANLKGSIRVQYAVTGIMARLFQSEDQADTAENILRNIRQQAVDKNYREIVPNIDATLVHCALLKGDNIAAQEWLEAASPNEQDKFYIAVRYQLLTKAKVYVALGREMDALYIITMLSEYAQVYKRTYIRIELLTLRAIILHKRNEDWEKDLIEATQLAYGYGLVRVFADYGAPLLTLWKQCAWSNVDDVPAKYIQLILKEMKHMAVNYPNYLKPTHKFDKLTKKELTVLQLMGDGLNNTQIAEKLSINLGTAKFHVGNILKKLNASNRTLAIARAKEEKLI